MRSVFLTGLILAVCVLFATAQESITIRSDRNDLSRPVSTLINQIRRSEKISVTYEDPRYANALDIEDVTAEVSKGSEVEKTYGPRILVPKGHPITFVYATESMRGMRNAKSTIERMLQEYASLGGPVFTVIEDGARLHVIPSEVLDFSGTRLHQGSILETLVSLPPVQRNGGEFLQAICNEIHRQTGYDIGIGPSVPSNYLARFHTSSGLEKKPAREAIAELLDHVSVAGSFDWDLYYDPADKAYMLNFAYIGPAGRNEQAD